jgi:radical SAM protein (TIGR04043 family)
VLCESARGVKSAVDLPIQGQCEPPEDDAWFRRMHDAGIDSLGMHLEVLTPALRAELMPGKASVSIERYMEAFASAVEVFGRGQVSTYVLAGLGDSVDTIVESAEQLIALGVYPFVVPFTPIGGTPLEDHPAPSAAFMHEVLAPIAAMLRTAGLSSHDIKAGCAKCGACSSLSSYESPR